MFERIEKERIAMMMIAGGMLLGLALGHATAPPRRDDRPMTQPRSRVIETARARLLSSRDVARCRRQITTAIVDGLIRERPSPGRIAVDEALWRALAPPARGRLMYAVSCESWRTAAPPQGEEVVAYGWTSGRRLATLRGMRRPAAGV